jgi:hypothetical protein
LKLSLIWGIIKNGDLMVKVKPIIWVASTKSDLISMPDDVRSFKPKKVRKATRLNLLKDLEVQQYWK